MVEVWYDAGMADGVIRIRASSSESDRIRAMVKDMAGPGAGNVGEMGGVIVMDMGIFNMSGRWEGEIVDRAVLAEATGGSARLVIFERTYANSGLGVLVIAVTFNRALKLGFQLKWDK